MDNAYLVELLKLLLRREVEKFCRSMDGMWSSLSGIIKTIKENRWESVFFGGTLRSLLLARLSEDKLGKPRDIDIVFKGPDIQAMRNLFANVIERETRFGGFHLRKQAWEFDVWPLEKTWLISQDRVAVPNFEYLPNTTFFNIEAIAVDIWPPDSGERRIFSGNDQFFYAILNQELEINREENPFPELCVVRALVLANQLDYSLGRKLVRYIAEHGYRCDLQTLDTVQEKHYGSIKISSPKLQDWIRSVSLWYENLPDSSLRLSDLYLPITGGVLKKPLSDRFADILRRWKIRYDKQKETLEANKRIEVLPRIPRVETNHLAQIDL